MAARLPGPQVATAVAATLAEVWPSAATLPLAPPWVAPPCRRTHHALTAPPACACTCHAYCRRYVLLTTRGKSDVWVAAAHRIIIMRRLAFEANCWALDGPITSACAHGDAGPCACCAPTHAARGQVARLTWRNKCPCTPCSQQPAAHHWVLGAGQHLWLGQLHPMSGSDGSPMQCLYTTR